MKTQEIADYLRKLRTDNNLTQKELAAKLHVTHQAVSGWENGKSLPDIDTLSKLGDIYNITIDEIILKDPNNTEEPKKSKVPNWLRLTLSYLGIMLSLFGLSLFFNYPLHYISHIVFTSIFFIVVLIYLLFFKLRSKKYEYLIVTGLLLIITLVSVASKGAYYTVNDETYLMEMNRKEMIFDFEFKEETEYIRINNIFDTYLFIYNKEEKGIRVININEFGEHEPYTIDTGNYNVCDMVYNGETIYFSSYSFDNPDDFSINKLEFETGEITTIYETNDIYAMHFHFGRIFLVSHWEFAGETNIYELTEDEEVVFIDNYNETIYDLTSEFVDYEFRFFVSIYREIDGEVKSVIQMLDSDFTYIENIFEIPSREVIFFKEDLGTALFVHESSLYLLEGNEVKSLESENEVQLVNVISDSLIRVEDKIYTKDFDLLTDYLFYREDYTNDVAFLFISDENENFYAIDNEFMSFVVHQPREENPILLPFIYRVLILVPSVFLLGLAVVNGHRKNQKTMIES